MKVKDIMQYLSRLDGEMEVMWINPGDGDDLPIADIFRGWEPAKGKEVIFLSQMKEADAIEKAIGG